MPYISKETVATIRKQLKEKFPKVKFSVRKEHSSSLNVHVMESPFDWSSTHMAINHFYPENYENKEFLIGVINIAKAGQKVNHYDADYGHIPNYYVNVEIGKWDKPHKKVVK
jgi:hypothetical protein